MEAGDLDIGSFGPAPRIDAKAYPGGMPDVSYLFCSDYIAPILMKGRRLEKAAVPGGTLASRLGGVPIRDRYLVVSYGSNPSPAQLGDKFCGTGEVFPVIRGHMRGFDVVYGNGFTKNGAVPATITRSRGTSAEMWAIILDKRQMHLMDETEGRGSRYDLVRIPGEMMLENGECFSPVYTYVMSAGVLAVDGGPARLREIPAKRKQFREFYQAEMFDALRDRLEPAMDDAGFRARIRDERKKYEDMLERIDYTMEYSVIAPGRLPGRISTMQRYG